MSGVNFINVLCARFSYESNVVAAFSSQKSTFVWKKRAKNVDEIDTRAQFHQHIYAQLLRS